MVSGSTKGFLLLEACISVLLIGLLGFSITAWYLHLVALEKEMIQRIQAVMLARSLLEKYKAFLTVPQEKKGRTIFYFMGY